ncbi:MAG: hypothetical protein JWR80_6726 [Bradyrhizobium sp.]|nr:hypothetical protein [Bradyrhizobium sp.]
MLDDTESSRLIALIAGEIVADPRGIVLVSLPSYLQMQLAANGDANTLLGQAFKICIADGRSSTPPAIAFLLRNLAPYATNHEQEITEVAARLELPPAPAADPFADLVIRDNVIFIDRHPLRVAVKRLLTNQTPAPILVVNGPRYSGKTRTGFLIEHIGRCRPDIRFCRIRVEEDDRPLVEDVFQDMITRLGGDPDVLPQSTNERRWPRDLANRVGKQLKDASKDWAGNWVLVLDGFNKERLSDQIAAFVLQLASNIVEVSPQSHRLLLIDYDVAALANVAQHFDVIDLAHLSEGEAVDELTRLFSTFNRPDIAELVSGILDGVQMPVQDLRSIGTRCETLYKQLRVIP